ncbi:Peptidyl-prolyl cis-trans isomerase B [Planctomycetes bacterium Pan216]|uniref:Peptidyl-prolyl cis-trans isomerase n=1 Tax=Kolteria novifilia TaxID=2527975 RepID=A0A518B7Q6_9BACT|nr:Peptidyl-prolyl cis-trans isomerase B [Planctomycetes bacterium Pan216]
MKRPMLGLLGLLLCASPLLAAEPTSFSEATRPPYVTPPVKSTNGKALADMKAKVEKEWDGIVFNKDGKPVTYLVTLETDKGDIEIEFFPQDAPNHVRSFIALADAGFFDGLNFHRTIPNFVIQGGCPKGDGSGGPGYCLKPEFNQRPHTRGALSMARAAPTDSAGSQFFVCHGDPRFLDGKYTVFGQVKNGMDVVDQIVGQPTAPGDRPLNPVKIKKATVTKN